MADPTDYSLQQLTLALLENERFDYALLIGSMGLFVILGAIMLATRNVDWYEFGRPPSEPPPTQPAP